MNASEALTKPIAPRDVALVLAAGPFALARTGLSPYGPATLDEYAATLAQLMRMHAAVQWWIGDLVAAAEREHGELAAQLLEDRAAQTVQNYTWVARAYPIRERRENVDWSVHAELAALPAPERGAMLEQAEREHWTSRRARREAQGARAKAGGAGEPPVFVVTVLQGRVRVSALSTAAAQIVGNEPVEMDGAQLTELIARAGGGVLSNTSGGGA